MSFQKVYKYPEFTLVMDTYAELVSALGRKPCIDEHVARINRGLETPFTRYALERAVQQMNGAAITYIRKNESGIYDADIIHAYERLRRRNKKPPRFKELLAEVLRPTGGVMSLGTLFNRVKDIRRATKKKLTMRGVTKVPRNKLKTTFRALAGQLGRNPKLREIIDHLNSQHPGGDYKVDSISHQLRKIRASVRRDRRHLWVPGGFNQATSRDTIMAAYQAEFDKARASGATRYPLYKDVRDRLGLADSVLRKHVQRIDFSLARQGKLPLLFEQELCCHDLAVLSDYLGLLRTHDNSVSLCRAYAMRRGNPTQHANLATFYLLARRGADAGLAELPVPRRGEKTTQRLLDLGAPAIIRTYLLWALSRRHITPSESEVITGNAMKFEIALFDRFVPKNTGLRNPFKGRVLCLLYAAVEGRIPATWMQETVRNLLSAHASVHEAATGFNTKIAEVLDACGLREGLPR